MSTSCVVRPTLTETLLETLTDLVTSETQSVTTIPGETSVVTSFSCILSASVPGSDQEECILTTEVLSTTIDPPETITTQVPITVPITTTATAFRTEFTTSCTTIQRPDPPDDPGNEPDDPNDGGDNGNGNNGGNGNNSSTQSNGGGSNSDPTPGPGPSPSPSPSDPPPPPSSSDTNTSLSPTDTSTLTPGAVQPNDRPAGSELGPIIGGALGGFFGLIAIVALIWFIMRRRKRWDDIFEKDFDVSLPSARRKKRFSLDIDDTPKPYQYGLVGHVQPPSPPPTKTSFGGASLGGAAAATTPDEIGNRLVDPFAAGPFSSRSNVTVGAGAGTGAALAGGLAIASAPLTPGAYSNAPSSRPSTASSMDPLVGRHAGQRSISATSSSHQQHSSNMSYDANIETKRLLSHSPSPSFTLGSAPIPMRSITPTTTSPFASTSHGLPPGARPPALYTSNSPPLDTIPSDSTAFPAMNPFSASSSLPADTNTTTKSPPTSPRAASTWNNNGLLDYPDRKATGSPLSFQEAPRRLQVTNPNQRESSVPSMFSPVNSVFSERLGGGQGFGEDTLAALGAAASGVNPERQGSWEGARLRKNSR